LIEIINKIIIVASSWLFIITVPKPLRISGGTQNAGKKRTAGVVQVLR